jgi:hypothetical protein
LRKSIQGLEGTIGSPAYVNLMDRLFGNGRVLPIYVGYGASLAYLPLRSVPSLLLQSYMHEVGYSPINFAREFWNLHGYHATGDQDMGCHGTCRGTTVPIIWWPSSSCTFRSWHGLLGYTSGRARPDWHPIWRLVSGQRCSSTLRFT